MNRRDMVTKIAGDAHLTRAQAAKALESFIDAVQSSLQKGDRVTISGFGSFAVGHRKARSVRDPRLGTPLRIAARRIPRFAPGLELREAVENPD